LHETGPRTKGPNIEDRGADHAKTEAAADERDTPAVNPSQLAFSSVRLCDYADCRKPLQKVMLCIKFKGVAYSFKDCQVCPPRNPAYAPSSPLVQETGKHSQNTRTKNLEKQATTLNVLRCAVRVSATLTVRAQSR
jgi:hypothetical protein